MIKPLFSFLSYLGKYSVYMWLTHTFYCYYYFQKIVTFSGVASIMFVMTMLLSYLTAFLLSYVEKGINALIQIVFNRRKKVVNES